MPDPNAKGRRTLRGPPSAEAARTRVERELSLPPTPPDDLAFVHANLGGEEVVIVSYPIPEGEPTKQLTAAEREIVRALLGGKSNAEIARERGSAERTVANQVASAYRKLAVRSRAELAARCALVIRGDS